MELIKFVKVCFLLCILASCTHKDIAHTDLDTESDSTESTMTYPEPDSVTPDRYVNKEYGYSYDRPAIESQNFYSTFPFMETSSYHGYYVFRTREDDSNKAECWFGSRISEAGLERFKTFKEVEQWYISDGNEWQQYPYFEHTNISGYPALHMLVKSIDKRDTAYLRRLHVVTSDWQLIVDGRMLPQDLPKYDSVFRQAILSVQIADKR